MICIQILYSLEFEKCHRGTSILDINRVEALFVSLVGYMHLYTRPKVRQRRMYVSHVATVLISLFLYWFSS